MARKNDTELWAQAKAYFEIGKSLTYISDTLDIDKSTISKRAKREGWKKGEFQRLCDESVRIKDEISTLNSTLQLTVENDVEERTRHLSLITRATHININRMMLKFNNRSKEYQKTMSIMENKLVQSTLKDARETLLGKDPTNQTNIQTNVTNEIIDCVEFVAVHPNAPTN